MYLEKEQRLALNEFIAGGIWQAAERALLARRSSFADAEASAESAAHRAFERKGYEKCLEDFRALAVESPPTEEGAIPITLTDPRD